MNALVRYERRDAVSVLTMDDGKANVQSVAMLEALGAALDRAEAEGTAVLLRGRDGLFSAGFDLAVFKRRGDELARMLALGARLSARLLAHPAPVVVACTGHAVAMGVLLVLAGDLRLGAAGAAHRIVANEVAIGLTLPRFATEMLRQRLTPAAFNRAAILSEESGPDGAVVAGFLDAVVPPAELGERALQAANALAKLPRSHYVATKLRARAPVLAALRTAVDEDAGEWARLADLAAARPPA